MNTPDTDFLFFFLILSDAQDSPSVADSQISGLYLEKRLVGQVSNMFPWRGEKDSW